MNAPADVSLPAWRAREPQHVVDHLDPSVWTRVNRLLVRKALAEFAHESVIAPVALGKPDAEDWRTYRVDADTAGCHYRFRAQMMALYHWRIDPASIERIAETRAPGNPPLDALTFVNDFKRTLGIDADKLPIYLDEISSTLFGAAYKHTRQYLPADALVDADYQVYESAMTEGHPCFVANNGRLGFDADEYRTYAPETGARFAIVWLAVHREHAHFACLPELDHDTLLTRELGAQRLAAYRQTLQALDLDPSHYLFMPAHPWQWFNKLSIAFAADVANRKIVALGYGADLYAAQQSVRTYFNTSHPEKCYVKTSLSVLNMGFMRGLSPHYMAGTPAINAYLHALIDGDTTLRAYGFSILREVASVGYRNRYYETALEQDSPYKKMLSALWRESPVSMLREGERLMTMAALLHVDPAGDALLPALIRRSGLPALAWLRSYLRAYLEPLMHCFYAHDLVFMPHCENLILVLEQHRVTRVFMKDIAEESAILDKDASLPDNVARLAVDIPDDFKLLGLFIDVFDGVFRHLGHLLVEQHVCTEDAFWQLVANTAHEYQAAHPELQHKFRRYDLFQPEFGHSCLNRLQLRNNLQMVNLADPASSLTMAGTLRNPLTKYRRD